MEDKKIKDNVVHDDIEVICRDCGEKFVIDDKTQKWYEDKGMVLPKRCISCRRARRQAKKEEEK